MGEEGIGRRLCSKGKSGKGVHDEVNPEDLHGGEHIFTKEDGTHEHEDHCDDVDSELELEELADGVKDVTAEFDGGESGAEIVSGKNDLGRILGGIGASSHGEANIGAFERRRVIGTVAGDSDDIVPLDEAGDEEILVLGGATSHHLEVLRNLVELVAVDDVVLLILIFTSLLVHVAFGLLSEL
jgi:hypothetical protein